MEWIKVENKKPKDETHAIVFDGHNVFTAWYDSYYEDEPEWTNINTGPLEHPITHWMPLPEPPKTET